MADEDGRVYQDREWSRRVADIAISTLVVSKVVTLTAEQTALCTAIVAEEIYIRLIIGDRPISESGS